MFKTGIATGCQTVPMIFGLRPPPGVTVQRYNVSEGIYPVFCPCASKTQKKKTVSQTRPPKSVKSAFLNIFCGPGS